MTHASITQETVIDGLRKLWNDQSGQGLVEYALIITFMALLCLAALRTLGQKASNSLTNASNNLS